MFRYLRVNVLARCSAPEAGIVIPAPVALEPARMPYSPTTDGSQVRQGVQRGMLSMLLTVSAVESEQAVASKEKQLQNQHVEPHAGDLAWSLLLSGWGKRLVAPVASEARHSTRKDLKMNTKTFLAASALASTLLWAGAANAAALVTFDPSNTNNGLGVISAANGQFQALGAQGFLNTTLTINAAVGNNVGFSEVGSFQVQNFTTSPAVFPNFGIVSSGVLTGAAGWNLVADIAFSGIGDWTANSYEATAGIFSLTLRAQDGSFNNLFTLGTASLIFGADSLANVTLVNGTNAITSISGTFDFTPAVGTTGTDGFFVAPDPFEIGFSVGNFGGNQANTTYTVDPITGVVSIFTPGPNLNAATGNLTFVSQAVPEPGVLALVGIALFGVAVTGRRKISKTV